MEPYEVEPYEVEPYEVGPYEVEPYEVDQYEKKEENKMAKGSCETCVNYVYDEEYECYCCLVNLDEDEMYHFLSGNDWQCPYYRLDDEYGVVRHQI